LVLAEEQAALVLFHDELEGFRETRLVALEDAGGFVAFWDCLV
jgi:hypothetical protein